MRKKWLVWLGVVWVIGILFPMAWFSGRSPLVNQWFERLFSPPWMHIVMHAGLYAVLAALGVLLARQFGRPLCLSLLSVALVGLLQEVIQTTLAGRVVGSGEWFDLGVDLTGGLLGFLAALAVENWRKKRAN